MSMVDSPNSTCEPLAAVSTRVGPPRDSGWSARDASPPAIAASAPDQDEQPRGERISTRGVRGLRGDALDRTADRRVEHGALDAARRGFAPGGSMSIFTAPDCAASSTGVRESFIRAFPFLALLGPPPFRRSEMSASCYSRLPDRTPNAPDLRTFVATTELPRHGLGDLFDGPPVHDMQREGDPLRRRDAVERLVQVDRSLAASLARSSAPGSLG